MLSTDDPAFLVLLLLVGTLPMVNVATRRKLSENGSATAPGTPISTDACRAST